MMIGDSYLHGVETCLAQIDLRESEVGAWQIVDPDAASARACEWDARESRPALHGMVVGVKDIFDTCDMPTTYGSPIFAGHRPDADADAVSDLRAAGAIVLGKTVSTEFAYLHPGKTANPANPLHTPGGSSSGSAAAVAAGMARVALGTQTAGSTIRPAAFCGVFGYKPTHGLVPMTGVRALAPSLDTVGLFARSVDDLKLLIQVLSRGQIRSYAVPADAHPSVGIMWPHHWTDCDTDTYQLFDRICMALQAHAGHCVAMSPFDVYTTIHAHRVILSGEAARGFEGLYLAHGRGFSPEFQALMVEGRAHDDHALHEALHTSRNCRDVFASRMRGFDFLVMPSAPGEAPLRTVGTGNPDCSRPATMLGVPALSIPCGVGRNGLPLGVQLVGHRNEDGKLLAWAEWFANQVAGKITGYAISRRDAP